MNNNNMIKTIFSVYRFLEKLAFSLDRIISSRALSCNYIGILNSTFNSVERVSNDILECTQRKINLINLKLFTEKILQEIDKDYARLMIMKYIDGKNYVEIAKTFSISERTAIRWHEAGVVQAGFLLEKEKFSDQLFKILKTEKWVWSVYDDFCEERTKKKLTNVSGASNVFKNACKEYRNIICDR